MTRWLVEPLDETTIYHGPAEIFNELLKVKESYKRIDESSRYQKGQSVLIKDDPYGIVSALTPTYKLHDAYMIALAVRCKHATIISPDILEDNGKLGTYYTVEVDDYPGFLVLPEKLLMEGKS